jgi:uroporphyrinogen-III synthase
MTDSYFKQIVLSTRPEAANDEFAAALKERGVGIMHMPTIDIAEPESWTAFDKAADALDVYSGILFTSVNAVGSFVKRLGARGEGINDLPPVHAVGEKTADALKQLGIPVETMPASGGAAELADALGDVDNQFYLHPTTDKARPELANIIQERGGKLNTVVVYRTVLPRYEDIRDVDEQLIMGEIDCVAFFSPSAARNFMSIIPGFKQATVLIATIGQTTAQAAMALGFRVDVIAAEQNAISLANAIADRFTSNEIIDFNDGEQVDLT